jgi:hypothetical protein
MPDPVDPNSLHSEEHASAATSAVPVNDAAGWTSDDIARWGGLIAAGEIPFPRGLSPAVEDRLATTVRLCRRERLWQLIARLIASDLLRAPSAGEGVTDDDST